VSVVDIDAAPVVRTSRTVYLDVENN